MTAATAIVPARTTGPIGWAAPAAVSTPPPISDALATRILFEGRRAVGVEYRVGGETCTARANAEVLVASGAFNSPQLLQLSGLGPASLRRRISPERVYDWDAVGGFSERGADGAASTLHLTSAAADLRRQGPADLAQLVAGLPPSEREQLTSGVAST